jgi:hypothetical protein
MRLVPSVLLALAVLSGTATPAAAQTEPKFEFAKPTDTKKVIWKLSTQAGLIYSTGNSRNVSVSGGADLSRDDGRNRFTFAGSGAYVRTTQRVARDISGNGTIGDVDGEIEDETRTTTALWAVKGRYDRFFTPRNTVYLSGGVLGNRPAGKIVVAAGQAGYSRLLFMGPRNQLVGEGGYDFTFERDVGSVPDLFIHSLRLFLGYGLKISENTAFNASVEALLNLNPENGPLGRRIAPIEDTRITGKAAITTKLWKILSLRVSFTARYDNAPAPLPALTIPYESGFLPLASRLDTITEVAIVASIL